MALQSFVHLSDLFSRNEKPTVGVIGVGDIGQGIASSIATAKFPLVVFDRKTEAAELFSDVADVADDLADLGSRSDIVIVAVVNDEQVKSVLIGPGAVLDSMEEGVVVIVSTISPEAVHALALATGGTGVAVIDCGVSGGAASAKRGELISMVGGDHGVIELVTPVLNAFSSLVVEMGPLGSGLLAKLARNIVQYGSWLAAYEGQRLAEAGGIDLEKLAQVIRASDAKIGGATTLMIRPSTEPFDEVTQPELVEYMKSTVAIAQKDLAAAIQAANAFGVELPGAELTHANCHEIFGVSVKEK